MRLSNPILVVLAFSVLAGSAVGCAAPTEATRGADTAVRAEPRRISSGSSLHDTLRPGVQSLHRAPQSAF
jgi:hypothetical protein